jgi:adenylate kinase family enzyme
LAQKVIVVSGLPGSGKSTIAEDIAHTLQLPIFSVDPIESSIIKSGIERSFETWLPIWLLKLWWRNN